MSLFNFLNVSELLFPLQFGMSDNERDRVCLQDSMQDVLGGEVEKYDEWICKTTMWEKSK